MYVRKEREREIIKKNDEILKIGESRYRIAVEKNSCSWKDIHVLIHRTYDYCHLLWQKDFTDLIKLNIWNLGGFPGLSG